MKQAEYSVRGASATLTPHIPITLTPQPWRQEALCWYTTEEESDRLFFPTSRAAIEEGLEVCARCPVKRECAREAIESGDAYGIRGGVLLSGNAGPSKDELMRVAGLEREEPDPETPEQAAKRMLFNGTPYKDVAKTVGISHTRVHAMRLEMYGPKKQSKPHEHDDRIREMSKDGVPVGEQARILGCDRKTVSESRVRQGLVEPRKRSA